MTGFPPQGPPTLNSGLLSYTGTAGALTITGAPAKTKIIIIGSGAAGVTLAVALDSNSKKAVVFAGNGLTNAQASGTIDATTFFNFSTGAIDINTLDSKAAPPTAGINASGKAYSLLWIA